MKNNEAYSIVIDKTRIPYRIRKSHRAKNIRLTFGEREGLVITLPNHHRIQSVEHAILEHKNWILNRAKERQASTEIPPPFLLLDGARLPVLDRAFPLSLTVQNQKKSLWSFQNNRLNITAPQLTRTLISRGVVQWYRTMAGLFLEERVPYWTQRIQVAPNLIRVKNQHTLWASCSKKANLNFNWRILLLSNRAADYLIIHELSHLKELNHSSRFWSLVQSFCPEYKTHQVELKLKNAWLKYPPDTPDSPW